MKASRASVSSREQPPSTPSSGSASSNATTAAACVFPSALVSEGVDGILYKGSSAGSPPKTMAHFQRKPPHLDFEREYKVAKSYRDARSTLDTLTKRHRQQQIAQEESFDRDVNANKFATQFVENRLGTNGVPTLNSMSVIIDRQRRDAAQANQQPNQHNGSNPKGTSKSDKIRDAVRRSYGSQTLDLKALELIHIPSEVYSTMLMQLARMIRCVNVSRNALREIPTEFCDAFQEAEVLVYKENALDLVPESIASLKYLKSLNLECNQLVKLPMRLPNSLEVLIVSRLRLTQMSNLHELRLSSHNLDFVPSSFSCLRSLRVLHLRKNKIRAIADDAFELPETSASSELLELDLEYNQLESLPISISNLKRLAMLKVSNNRLTSIPESIGNLSTELKEVHVAHNRFQQPPSGFSSLLRLEKLHLSHNHLRNLDSYLLKRQQRIQEITALLTANRFPFDTSCFQELKVRKLLVRRATSVRSDHSDVSRDVCEEGEDSLKFLTQKHLDAFDRAVNEYVNGNFYLFDTRGADLVNDLLLKTQFALAQRHREQVLADLLKLCKLIKTKKWVDKVDFRYECDRPWGRNGEDGVFMLNPSIIYEDQQQENDVTVPSIISVIKMRVRHGFENEGARETVDERLGFGYDAFLDAVVTKLMEKVGMQVKNHLIQQQREKAIEFGWRRLWDGRNGREFEKCKLLVRRKMLDNGTMEKEDKPAPNAAGEGGTGAADDEYLSDNSEISDVSFEGYEDLVRTMNSPGQVLHDNDDEYGGDDGDDDEGEKEADLANLVVSDVSDDETNADDKKDESEDSEI